VLNFQRAALERDGEGMFLLGRAYLTGHGVEEDVVRGARWYREACKAGYTEAKYALSRCYFEGCGVDKRPEKGMQYLREAAQSGDTRAMFALSLRLNTAPKTHTGGGGVTDEGILWLEKAAAGGHPKALYNLALHLKREAGVAALPEEEEEEEEEEGLEKSGGAPKAGRVKEKGSLGRLSYAKEGGGGRERKRESGGVYEYTALQQRLLQRASEHLRAAAALGHPKAAAALRESSAT
jgi:TPR repeat protein